jgi:Holliday junction resolvase
MPNKNYQNGASKERRVVRKAKGEGCLAFRSAGSHSPIDVCIIDHKNKKIKFVQCKPRDFSKNEKKRIEESLEFLKGSFEVSFEVQ